MKMTNNSNLSILTLWVFTLAFNANVYLSINRNSTNLTFFGILMALELFGMLLIYKNFCQEPKIKVEKPEFEPPDLLPWQADYLLSEGKIGGKRTFLSYLIWLNNQKFVNLHNFQKLEIEKKLPDILPETYNQYVELIAKNGMSELNMSDNNNPNILLLDSPEVKQKTTEMLNSQLAKFYQIKPLFLAPGVFSALCIYSRIYSSRIYSQFLVYILIFFVPFCYISYKLIIKNKDVSQNKNKNPSMSNKQLLVWFLFMIFWLLFCVVVAIFINNYNLNEFFIIIGFTLVLNLPIYLFVWSRWGKLSSQGIYYSLWSKQYRFYLEKAEKDKLNFANNWENGLQSYLPQVAFAAQFGFLKKLENINKNI